MVLGRSGLVLASLLSLFLRVAAGEIKHRFVATDESGKQLLYVDEVNPDNDWTIPLKGNRDVQLSGNGTVLVSVPAGYREYGLRDGKLIKEVKVGTGIQSLVRLGDGRTLLASKRAVIELDPADKVTRTHAFTMSPFFRLLRVAGDGNLLFTSGETTIRECRLGAAGTPAATVRELDLSGLTPESRKPYFVEQVENGQFIIATGFGATILIVDADWKLIRSCGGKGKVPGVRTHFFADAQRLPNGNIVVAHWSGHARKDSAKAPQAIEFDRDGNVVWSWHDPERAGTLHGIEVIE